MIESSCFGTTDKGETVTCYTLTNDRNIQVSVLDFGAIIHSVKTPDRIGDLGEITVGYDSLDQYLDLNQYFGAFVGRYANRIRNGRFFIDDRPYQVSQNLGTHHLHGGFSGFDRKIWNSRIIREEGREKLCLNCSSPDSEEGFPGNMKVKLTYALTAADEFVVEYEAVTDKSTVINLTSHAYFNLTGDPDRDILNHHLRIAADRITEVDEACIPTGSFMKVEHTPFDFQTFHAIGERIEEDHIQLSYGNGYDHNFAIKPDLGYEQPAASVVEPSSGRRIDFYTTQPGFQFYSGNNLVEESVGKDGCPIRFRHAFCLEPQHFPDAPNHNHFPSTRLDPGQTYSHKLVMKFTTTDGVVQ